MIIDSNKSYMEMVSGIEMHDLIIHPIHINDITHTAESGLSLLMVYDIISKRKYILLNDHSELIYKCDITEVLKLKNKKFILNKKPLEVIYPKLLNTYDLNLSQYLDYGTKITLPNFNVKSFYTNLYPQYSNLNCIIPALKWLEYFNIIIPILLDVTLSMDANKTYNIYNDIFIPALSSIERNGLKTDSKMLYSIYNIYTTTGRPSNTFGGVNFAALNKNTGIRKKFVSRHKKGILLEFDYDAYHLRIISNLVGVPMINDSLHRELAKLYFNKEVINDEEYEKSKQISFRQLYGGILKEYEHIDLFKKTKQYIIKLWKDWKSEGYIESPYTGRRIYKKHHDSLYPQKLFNYFIQLLETEINLFKVDDLINSTELQGKNSKLILYTYDSFTLDFDVEDGKETYDIIRRILSNGYQVRAYMGTNYDEMAEILD